MAAGRVLLGVAGVGSIVGVGAADVIRRIGSRRVFLAAVFIEAAATALLAAMASSLSAAIISAFAFGVSYNIAVAVTVLTLAKLHPERPASAVALIAGANAVGLVFSPLAGGALSTQVGLRATLICAAGILLASAVGAPPDQGEHPSA